MWADIDALLEGPTMGMIGMVGGGSPRVSAEDIRREAFRLGA